MGVFSWFQDCWIMMMRTKPQYISVLGRKRSSIRSPPKLNRDEEKTCKTRLKSCVCLVVMCCSISYGVVLLLIQDTSSLTAANLMVPLIVAGVASVSGGLCLSEYISSKSQEVPSVYSCCYQYSSEVLAFFIGWSWLLSQAAVVAAICKISAMLVNQWTDNALQNALERSFLTYADAIPSIAFALAFVFFVSIGLNESLAWYVCSVPLVFVLIVSTCILTRASNKELLLYEGSWFDIQSVDQILKASSLCMLFFTGPQGLLRITQKQVNQKTSAVLGPLNIISIALVFALLFAAPQSGALFGLKSPSNSTASLGNYILSLVCLCVLGIEAFYPLHYVIEDMASDGLLFRTFSKKVKPFCVPVASPTVQTLTVIAVCVLVALLPPSKLLHLSVMFPLAVNTVVPYLVLVQRYRDNTSWQYEPMFHTTAKSVRDRSRRRSEESQYTNGVIGFDHTEALEMSTTCIEEGSSEGNSSDTDIDSVVQQYRDQARIANMATLDEHGAADQVPEPTPTSSFRARLAIAALFVISAMNSVALNFSITSDQGLLVALSLGCLLVSTVVQGVLLCFPQNRSSSSAWCIKMPRMPWMPGISSFVNICLLVNCGMMVWNICLVWFGLGVLIYFAYGIRSSTAANSFYNLRPAHIALCPLPSYGNKCVTQVVPSQRKKLKTKLQKNGRRKPIMA